MPGRLFPENYEGAAPPEFGRNANILKTRTFALDNARDLEEIEIGGSCLWAIAATTLTASIDIRINDQLRDPVTFQQGMFIRGIPFSRLYVSHAAQAGETLTLFFAREEDVNNIEIVNPSIGFNNINVTKAHTLTDLTDVTIPGTALAVVLAPNVARRRVFITSLASNISIIRIGEFPTATRGIELAPGESFGVDTTDAIRGYNTGAGAQDVSVLYTSD